MSPGARRAVAIGRGVLLVFAAVAGLCVFAHYTREHYPIGQWMFWVYLKIWGYTLLFGAASFSLGHLALRAIRVSPLPWRERLVFTLASGVFGFFWLVFAGGLLGILRGWFCVAMPIACIAAAAVPLYRAGRRPYAALRSRRLRGVTARPLWATPTLLFGAFGVFLVYYGLLSPKNIAFDAHFYHLGIAQEYAVDHAIRAFPEGWMPGALPQLASVIYAWGISLPGLDMFDRLVLVQHLEFVVFLFTLASIPTLVRYLVPRVHPKVSWAAVFLFPGILVYDSTLSGAADHIGAFWAIPVWLAFRRAFHALDPRASILFALVVSAAVLTKYQTMYFVIIPIVALVVRAAWLMLRPLVARWRRHESFERGAVVRPLVGLGCAAVFGLLFSSPHWLKNLFFYGDPLFPYLHKYLGAARWGSDEGHLFDVWNAWQSKNWIPTGSAKARLIETLGATFGFSFRPHDWSTFHGKIPVFGSLYTLSLLCLPFLRNTRRIWALAGATQAGVFIWYWTMHQDRYLQALLPWMAAVVAATIALAWRAGWHGRVAIGGLVAYQIVWGADAYLYPAHSMTKQPAMTVTNELLSMHFKKDYEGRWKVSGALFDLGSSTALPANARVLLHENNPRLGVWRSLLSDMPGWEFGLRYEKYATPRAMDDKLDGLGVTHVVARAKRSRGYDSLGADLRFYDYVAQELTVVKTFGEFTLYAVPDRATRQRTTQGGDRVAYFGCSKLYEKGMHALAALDVRDKQLETPPPTKPAEKTGAVATLVAEADFVVTEPHCGPDKAALGAFVDLGARGKEEMWGRRRVETPSAEPAPGAPAAPSAAPAMDDHLLDQ